MVTLLQDCTTLRSTPVIMSGDSLYRYRVVLCTDDSFGVHVESRSAYGSSGEQWLYQGTDLAKANAIYDLKAIMRYSNATNS